MKKKIFRKAMFLILALMMMMTPFNFAVVAQEAEMELAFESGDCCAEHDRLIELAELEKFEEPIVVTMSSACSHSWTILTISDHTKSLGCTITGTRKCTKCNETGSYSNWCGGKCIDPGSIIGCLELSRVID